MKITYQSLLEENNKVKLHNNDEEPWCTGESKEPSHMMDLPTCKQKFCKYAFFLHLQTKLFSKKRLSLAQNIKKEQETTMVIFVVFLLEKIK